MQVRDAIILSAGKGTRMGPIGEVLAKPMWPFFGHNLLTLQINFLTTQFGVENFYINSHHLYKQLETLKSSKVKIIFEPDLLDQGGGVLNIMKSFDLWDKPVLVNNSDQLYFVGQEEFRRALEMLQDCKAVLFGLSTTTERGYNKLLVNSEGFVTGIVPNNKIEEFRFQTYSGMSLIKCEKRAYTNEKLSFFNSIAKLNSNETKLMSVEEAEYYDFGKLAEYYDLCMNFKSTYSLGSTNKLIELLKKIGVTVDLNSEGINFSSNSGGLAKKGKIIFNEGELFISNGVVTSSKFS